MRIPQLRPQVALGVLLLSLVTVGGTGLVALKNQPAQRKPAVASTPATSRLEPSEPARSEPSPSPSELPKPVVADPVRAAATTTTATATARLANLTISRIGIREAPVFSGGVDPKGTMLIAPGYSVTHYAGSAGFGFGNSVIYGHDDIEGSVFGRLHDLKPGDEVQLSYAWGGQRSFRVADSKLVDPSAVEVLKPTGDVRLTIISCWPINIDTQRIIVTAFPA